MGRIITNEYFGGLRNFSQEELLGNLYPSPEFMFGYLGKNEDLDQIIAEDEKILARLGFSHEKIAQAIENVFLTDEPTYNGNHLIRRAFIESPECPWRDYCTVSPFDLSLKVTEIIMINKEKIEEAVTFLESRGSEGTYCFPDLVNNDLGMIFSDLHPHLIREHHFFEGKDTPYRVDPERAIRYLGI